MGTKLSKEALYGAARSAEEWQNNNPDELTCYGYWHKRHVREVPGKSMPSSLTTTFTDEDKEFILAYG